MARSTSFYYSFLVLPPPKRRAILAVFDFCRAVDDAVDLAPDAARAAESIEMWRREVDCVFGGGLPTTPQGRDLSAVVGPFGLAREHFDALVEGVAMDALPRRYETFADLEPYCHRVASAVGLMSVAIFGYRSPAVLDYARDLGVALQLTNILRDVAVDFRQGRVYLPMEDLARFGSGLDDLKQHVEQADRGLHNERLRSVLEHQAARARVFFARATRALPSDEVRNLLPAEIMRAIYWDLLRRIEAARCDVFSEVIRVPRPAQARIALGTWWTVRRGKRMR